MDIGETIAQCAEREVQEETGLTVKAHRVVGIYSDPDHVFAYSDGEVRQEFSVCFACRILAGELSKSDESLEVRFWPVGETRHPRHAPINPAENISLSLRKI